MVKRRRIGRLKKSKHGHCCCCLKPSRRKLPRSFERPPRRFCWRGVTYDITGAQGPERIADEWWRTPYPSRGGVPTRDYYLVEDGEGHRFWLYREGLYGRETATPRWFVHGLFA